MIDTEGLSINLSQHQIAAVINELSKLDHALEITLVV